MNPMWILIAMAAVGFLCSLTASIYDERCEEAGDDWRGDTREELAAAGEALKAVPTAPVALVVASGGDILAAGGPVWWWWLLLFSALWCAYLVVLSANETEEGPSLGDAPIDMTTDVNWR